MAGLIIEGPDGAGKTELARKIQYRTFWPVVHLVQPGYPDVRQMFNLLEVSPLIFDRFHLSSKIYGQILRGRPELSDHEVWMLEGLLKAQAYKLVICIVPLEVMLGNNHKATQLWDEVRNEDVLKRLRKAYIDEALRTPLEFRIYDYTIDSAEELYRMGAGAEARSPIGRARITEAGEVVGWQGPRSMAESGNEGVGLVMVRYRIIGPELCRSCPSVREAWRTGFGDCHRKRCGKQAETAGHSIRRSAALPGFGQSIFPDLRASHAHPGSFRSPR